VNRHNSCGDRVARGKSGHSSYICGLGDMDRRIRLKKIMTIIWDVFDDILQPDYLDSTKESPKTG
jgi:hypothetical protein